MTQALEKCVIRILFCGKNREGSHDIAGAGFVFSDQLAVTCAHVIESAGRDEGGKVLIRFYEGDVEQRVDVLAEGWSPAT